MRVTVRVERDPAMPGPTWTLPKLPEVVVDLTGEFSDVMTARVLRAVADSIYKEDVR